MQDTGWNGAPSLSCILHHASCIFLYSKKCSGTAETRGSARVPHPRPMRTGLAPHPRFGPTSIFLNSRRGIQKIERLGARSVLRLLGVGPGSGSRDPSYPASCRCAFPAGLGLRCSVFGRPGSGYRVAKIRTLPILHHASCILHLYLNKAIRQYGHMAISYYPSFVTRHSSLHHFVTPSPVPFIYG
jgi:hypothetical protein